MSSKFRKEHFSTAVVGEGPTEWCYFDYIRTTRNINFKLKPSLPRTASYKEVLRKGNELAVAGYDLVFCVIDMDKIYQDNTENKFFQECKKLKKGVIPVVSYPCTEIWFLMHFMKVLSLKEYQSFEQLKPQLKKYISDYCKEQKYLKSYKPFVAMEKDKGFDRAMKNSKKILTKKSASDSVNFSYSEFCELFELLNKCTKCDKHGSCDDCINELNFNYFKKHSC